MERVEQLVKTLNEHKVIFVVIGAYSLPPLGYSRTTLDIDFFIKPIRSNAEKTLDALKEFGYDVTDASVGGILKKKFLIRGYDLDADIHPFVKGVDFKTVWKNKIKSKIFDTECYFSSLEDMIKMKKAAGRVKDKEDLKYLTAILKRKKKKNEPRPSCK